VQDKAGVTISMKRPLLIGIGASHSGSGKTTLAARILNYFSPAFKSKPLTPVLKWGAIKYTRTASSPELITDRATLMEKGKDTWHMLTSGASDVVWVRSDRAGLGEALPEALKRLSHLDAVVVEGNSAIEFLKPDIVIFIFSKGKKHWKPGIEALAARADIIFHDAEAQLPADAATKQLFPMRLSGNQYEAFFETLTRMVYERTTEARDAEKGC
jgi:molybdopterin-guanine dinucleotide biosynthesis protein MobB